MFRNIIKTCKWSSKKSYGYQYFCKENLFSAVWAKQYFFFFCETPSMDDGTWHGIKRVKEIWVSQSSSFDFLSRKAQNWFLKSVFTIKNVPLCLFFAIEIFLDAPYLRGFAQQDWNNLFYFKGYFCKEELENKVWMPHWFLWILLSYQVPL